ncbi:GD22108 [Drosophila simulans]|uniref:GD22108 n=1 Tax=Drosophila simulans TaxID=7240 RepID=B4Q477_DROSI|nr:GD22108 [Drosophila simulans]
MASLRPKPKPTITSRGKEVGQGYDLQHMIKNHTADSGSQERQEPLADGQHHDDDDEVVNVPNAGDQSPAKLTDSVKDGVSVICSS